MLTTARVAAAGAEILTVAGAAADGTTTVKGAPKWIMPVLAVVAIGAGVGSVATVINAGHSGAKSVWEDVQGGEGG